MIGGGIGYLWRTRMIFLKDLFSDNEVARRMYPSFDHGNFLYNELPEVL